MIRTARTLRIALLASAALAAGGAARSAQLVPTATRSIDVASVAGATDLGALAAATPLTVRVGLLIQNKAALLTLLQGQAAGSSAALTPAQFRAGYAPSNAQVAQVVSWLGNAGFTNITVEPNGLLVNASGTAASATAAFGTALEAISVGGAPGYVNTTAATVPAALGGVVAGVLGLNTVGHMAPTIAFPGPQYLVSYTPRQFQTLYAADGLPFARHATIAIMAEGDMTGVVKDLRIAEKAFALPRAKVQVVQVGVASPDVAGADEWDMDTQYSTGMAGNVQELFLYTTTSLSDSDLALEFSRWASDDVARGASASLGECEAFPYLDGSMAIDDEIFLEAAAQGQSFFASSGDTGSFCPLGPAGANGVPAGAPLVSYPAASPYVIGAGGTTLLSNADGSYDTEATWYAGGGGVSQFEGSPFWQQAVSVALKTANLRAVPDVAMDADPNSGALVYVNGQPEGVGGTSLSSPLALGVWARAVSARPKLGNAGPVLYSFYDASGTVGAYPKGGFHDIIAGSNGLYPATPGFDLTTGLGTFVVNQLVAGLPRK